MKQHDEEDTCVPLKEGACSVWRELKVALENLEGHDKAWEEDRTTLLRVEKEAVKNDEENAKLQHENAELGDRLRTIARAAEAAGLRMGDDPDFDICRSFGDGLHGMRERDEAKAQNIETRRVWNEFIQDCAGLLGLPKLDEVSEYGGGAVRKGIARLREDKERGESSSASVLADMGVKRDPMCDSALAQLQVIASHDHGEAMRLRAMGEKVNEIRNDIIARQSMGWSAHIYPLVAALNEVGFRGAEYKVARVALEATIASARGMAARAWCSKTTEHKEMDVVLAEEFAEILFPLLQALAFYAREETWADDCDDWHEECFRCDRGSRARLALGQADRGEVVEEEDVEVTFGNPMTLARQKVARAWCTKETEQKVMDPVLAEAFAAILAPYLAKCAFSDVKAPAERLEVGEGEEEIPVEMRIHFKNTSLCFSCDNQTCAQRDVCKAHVSHRGEQDEERTHYMKTPDVRVTFQVEDEPVLECCGCEIVE